MWAEPASSHQFCRGFGQRGHRDRWHLLRGHEELSVPCHICAVSPARTHPIQPYFDQTSPRTEEGGSLCAIRSRRINASQPSRAIIVVRRAEAEASLRSLRSGGNEVSQSLLPPPQSSTPRARYQRWFMMGAQGPAWASTRLDNLGTGRRTPPGVCAQVKFRICSEDSAEGFDRKLVAQRRTYIGRCVF